MSLLVVSFTKYQTLIQDSNCQTQRHGTKKPRLKRTLTVNSRQQSADWCTLTLSRVATQSMVLLRQVVCLSGTLS